MLSNTNIEKIFIKPMNFLSLYSLFEFLSSSFLIRLIRCLPLLWYFFYVGSDVFL